MSDVRINFESFEFFCVNSLVNVVLGSTGVLPTWPELFLEGNHTQNEGGCFRAILRGDSGGFP